jgi:Bacterial RNA polymerase, alpha chain C terminal domain
VLKISETNLSNRAKNALAKAGIVYVEEIPSVPVLRTKRGMGRVTVKEIKGLIDSSRDKD